MPATDEATAAIVEETLKEALQECAMQGIKGPGDALGASATFEVGALRLRRDVQPGGSYCASSDPRVHVGLGAATRVDKVRVRWRDGAEESFGPFDADQILTLRRGEGD